MFKGNIDEIELIIKYSKLVEKFFEKHLNIENQFLKNLEVFYIGKEKNIDIKNIVLELQTLCENLENGFWKDILKEINQINYLKDKKIELKLGNEVISGVAQNIDENGELEILIEKGDNRKPEVRSFSVGEVFEKIVYSS